MPNRYDSPAQAQFMQTYIPVPFEDILQAGLTKQKTYDTNRSSFEQAIADTQNLGYIPNSQDQAYIESLRSKLESVRDQYLDKDYSNPEITRQLYKDINANVNRNLVNRIQQSHEGYKQYQQLAAKATSEGKSLFNPYNFTGYSTEGSGIFTGQPEPLHNYAAKKETYFDRVPYDTWTDPNTGKLYKVRNAAKLAGVADTSKEDYATSTEGRQEIEGYRNASKDYSTPDAVLANKFLKDRAKELEGYELIGMDPAYGANRKEQEIQPDISNSSNTQSLRNENRVSESDVKSSLGFNPAKVNTTSDILGELPFDSKGMLTYKVAKRPVLAGTQVQSEYNEAKKAGKTSAKDPWEYKQMQEQKENNKEYQKVKTKIETIKRLNPNLIQNENGKPASDVQILEAYAKAYNNLENQDYNTYLYETYKVSESAKARNNRQIIEDIPGRKIRIAESGKLSGKPISSLEDLYEELDIPAADRKSENLSITGIAPSLNAYKAIINSSKGMKSFLISTSKREQNMFNLVEKATKLSSKGDVGEEKFEHNGKKYIITTRIDGNQGNYGFTSNIRTEDGSELIPGAGKSQMGMDAFEDYTVANFMFNL